MIITEKTGKIKLVNIKNKKLNIIKHNINYIVDGQGGLLDIIYKDEPIHIRFEVARKSNNDPIKLMTVKDCCSEEEILTKLIKQMNKFKYPLEMFLKNISKSFIQHGINRLETFHNNSLTIVKDMDTTLHTKWNMAQKKSKEIT